MSRKNRTLIIYLCFSVVPGLEQNIRDKSRATHADAAIHPLLFAINHHVSDDYYTTSSCAGLLEVVILIRSHYYYTKLSNKWI